MLSEKQLNNYKLSGEIHKLVKSKVFNYINSNTNIDIYELRNVIDYSIRTHTKDKHQQNDGLAFPIGININNIAAHFTPTKLTNYTLKNNDLCKIDYGVHIDGCIIDSAFSLLPYNSKKENNDLESVLINSSKNMVNTIIKEIGVDTKFSEIVSMAEEIISGYEYNDNQEMKPIKLIDNLYSHTIKPWKVHGGKFIKPDCKTSIMNINGDTMNAGEVYAIEFFTTNGTGKCKLSDNRYDYTHYNIPESIYLKKIPLFPNNDINKILKLCIDNFKTLPFCPNFIENYETKKINVKKNINTLQKMFEYNLIQSHPPLLEEDSISKIAQYEHTIYIDEKKTIKLSQD